MMLKEQILGPLEICNRCVRPRPSLLEDESDDAEETCRASASCACACGTDVGKDRFGPRVEPSAPRVPLRPQKWAIEHVLQSLDSM